MMLASVSAPAPPPLPAPDAASFQTDRTRQPMADWTGVARADHPASPTPDAPAAPLDPRRLLTSLGEVVYDWDLASDRLSFGDNGPDVIGLNCGDTLATG